MKCPSCGSPSPRLHPAVQAGGEVYRICEDAFHDKGFNSTRRPRRGTHPVGSYPISTARFDERHSGLGLTVARAFRESA